MNITKRQLNKQLKSRILYAPNTRYTKHMSIKVLRARPTQYYYSGNPKTKVPHIVSVDITISGIVLTTRNDWCPLQEFGPRHIRKFLRRDENKIVSTVESWVKLWGFSPSLPYELTNIKLVNNPCDL